MNIEQKTKNKESFHWQVGFTLIELLITVSIIAILTAISAFALNGSRESARDARRKTDLEQIKSALEIYKADCNMYPASLPGVGSSLQANPTVANCAVSGSPINTYMQKTPADPKSDGAYSYSRPTTSTYIICAYLEDPPSPANDTSGCPACSGGTCGYKVTNP